jgi:tetratricopeptide (TPR) repeat protein
MVNLGWLLLQEGGHESAERLARMALETDANNTKALGLLGQVLVQAGREAEALGAFGRALSLDPQLTGPWFGAAMALLRQGQPEEARSRLEELFQQAGRMGHPVGGLTPARGLYVEIQERLVQRDLVPMRQAAEDFKRRLEDRHGVPSAWPSWNWNAKVWSSSQGSMAGTTT